MCAKNEELVTYNSTV